MFPEKRKESLLNNMNWEFQWLITILEKKVRVSHSLVFSWLTKWIPLKQPCILKHDILTGCVSLKNNTNPEFTVSALIYQ